LLLQAAYGDYQIGTFENFNQLVEDTLSVLRPGPKVFFQYELRFVDRLKSQLLIGHLFLPIKEKRPGKEREQEIKPLLGNIPVFLNYLINFYFNAGGAQRAIAAAFRFNTASEVPCIFEWLARLSRRVCLLTLFGSGAA